MTGRAVERAPEERVRLEDRLRGPVIAAQAQRSSMPAGRANAMNGRFALQKPQAFRASDTAERDSRHGSTCRRTRCRRRRSLHIAEVVRLPRVGRGRSATTPTLVQIVRLTPERVHGSVRGLVTARP
jgi:hypothetical protein